MKLSRYEQETILNFNEEEKTASVYTHNKALQRKVQKLVEKRPEECKLDGVSHDGQAVSFIVPKSWIKVSPPRKRQLTDEQRNAAAERLRRINSKRQKHDN